jgi:adenylate cyclase
MNRVWRGLLIGLLIAIAGTALFFSPWGLKVEEELGLAMLFKIRGPRLPPDGVVIVNLDQDPSSRLGLPENFTVWPRTIHARMVDRLKGLGAGAIAFDVHFVESRHPADDLVLAESIRRAGNVILFAELKRRTIDPSGDTREAGKVAIDILVPPIPPLADAALALAPFPIPKRPVRISQTWLFKQSAGEMPTLPVVVLQTMAGKHDAYLQALLGRNMPDRIDTPPASSRQAVATTNPVDSIRAAREIFKQRPELAVQLLSDIAADQTALPSPADRALLQALVRMYAGKDNIHVNYYGPPATLPTLSYSEILSPESPDTTDLEKRIRGRAVFIGAARKTWSGQKDGFYTVFSQLDGLDLSGVEIAATVYGNLLENSQVRRSAPVFSTALLVACSLAACLISFLLSPAVAAIALAALAFCYLSVVSYFFTRQGGWPPLIIPLAMQLPAAILASILCKYVRACQERGNVRKALQLYLPDNVVSELTSDLSFIRTGDRMVYSACLITDARHYTTLSEKLSPAELSRLMKDYFEHLFRPVNECDGQVCNVIGDSMLALWPSVRPLAEPRTHACQAALLIQKAVEQFNRKHPDNPLPTRIGLHYGYLLMGNIGAESHFEYAPVGDIVNTASRIEGLNKLLGTRILASEAAIQGITGIATRRLGMFLFEGKTQPIAIYELLASGDNPEKIRAISVTFPSALENFQHREWMAAIEGFKECTALLGDDGPSRFYLQLSRSYREQPPPVDWGGTLLVGK